MIKLSSTAFSRLMWGLICSLAANIFVRRKSKLSDKSSQMTSGEVRNNEAQQMQPSTRYTSGNKDWRPVLQAKNVYEGRCDGGLWLLGSFQKQEKHLSCRVVNLASLNYTKVCRVDWFWKKKSWKQRWIIRSMDATTEVTLIQLLYLGRSELQQNSHNIWHCCWCPLLTDQEHQTSLEAAASEGHQTENTSKGSHNNDERCGKYTFDGTLWELKAKSMTYHSAKVAVPRVNQPLKQLMAHVIQKANLTPVGPLWPKRLEMFYQKKFSCVLYSILWPTSTLPQLALLILLDMGLLEEKLHVLRSNPSWSTTFLYMDSQ